MPADPRRPRRVVADVVDPEEDPAGFSAWAEDLFHATGFREDHDHDAEEPARSRPGGAEHIDAMSDDERHDLATPLVDDVERE